VAWVVAAWVVAACRAAAEHSENMPNKKLCPTSE
jgi:hypothetical protein